MTGRIVRLPLLTLNIDARKDWEYTSHHGRGRFASLPQLFLQYEVTGSTCDVGDHETNQCPGRNSRPFSHVPSVSRACLERLAISSTTASLPSFMETVF